MVEYLPGSKDKKGMVMEFLVRDDHFTLESSLKKTTKWVGCGRFQLFLIFFMWLRMLNRILGLIGWGGHRRALVPFMLNPFTLSWWVGVCLVTLNWWVRERLVSRTPTACLSLFGIKRFLPEYAFAYGRWSKVSSALGRETTEHLFMHPILTRTIWQRVLGCFNIHISFTINLKDWAHSLV